MTREVSPEAVQTKEFPCTRGLRKEYRKAFRTSLKEIRKKRKVDLEAPTEEYLGAPELRDYYHAAIAQFVAQATEKPEPTTTEDVLLSAAETAEALEQLPILLSKPQNKNILGEIVRTHFEECFAESHIPLFLHYVVIRDELTDLLASFMGKEEADKLAKDIIAPMDVFKVNSNLPKKRPNHENTIADKTGHSY